MLNSTPVDVSPPTNHVFVDFENLHKVDLSAIGQKAVSFTLLLGAQQTKIDTTLVEKLMEHAASVHLVRLKSSGKNAVDFALSYYLGRAVLADPMGYFHVVSKDTGYDPLIEHLRSRHIHAHRHDGFSTLSFSGSTKASPAPSDELLKRAVEHLREHPKNRPKKKATLVRHLQTICGVDADATGLVEQLCKNGYVAMGDKDAVTYLF